MSDGPNNAEASTHTRDDSKPKPCGGLKKVAHHANSEESQCGAERLAFVFWLRVVHMSKAAGLTFFWLAGLTFFCWFNFFVFQVNRWPCLV